jgi:hypothetical protein
MYPVGGPRPVPALRIRICQLGNIVYAWRLLDLLQNAVPRRGGGLMIKHIKHLSPRFQDITGTVDCVCVCV